jgi:hypothetical protein
VVPSVLGARPLADRLARHLPPAVGDVLAGAPSPPAAVGTPEGQRHQPERCPHDDAADRGPNRRQSDAGGGQRDLQLGDQAGAGDGESVPTSRPESDRQPRARVERRRDQAVVAEARSGIAADPTDWPAAGRGRSHANTPAGLARRETMRAREGRIERSTATTG